MVGSLMNPVVDAVDVDSVIDRIDVNETLDRVNVRRLIDRIDVNRVLDRIDVDQLLARIDVNALLERVDIDELAQRLDVDALVQRVDVEKLVDRVNVEGVVERINVGNVVTESAGTVVTSSLDLCRRQLAGLDAVTTAAARRLFRRQDGVQPTTDVITGRPAGAFTRLVAFFVDTAIVSAGLAVGVAVASYLIGLFLRHTVDPASHGGLWWALIHISVFLLYQWVAFTLAGRTFGMGLLGLRVRLRNGDRIGPRAALIRVLVFPFSFILGLGFIGVVFGREHRALHDVAAGTLIVHDWGSRPANLPHRVAARLSR